MDGVFYTCDDFEGVRLKMRQLFPQSKESHLSGKTAHTEKFDVYNWDKETIILTNSPYEGVLVFSKSPGNEEKLKSSLEYITGTTLNKKENPGVDYHGN